MPAATALNLYIVLSKDIPNRVQNTTRNLQWIKQVAESVGLAVRFHSLSQPTAEEIEQMIKNEPTKALFETRLTVQKDLQEDPVYKSFLKPLTFQQVSNYERHRMAFMTIQDASPDDYHLVLEDDVYIFPDMEIAWREMMTKMKAQPSKEVPLVWFGIVRDLISAEPFSWNANVWKILTREHPLLPSKEAYLIHPTVAKKLYEATHIIQMDMRHTMSRWIYYQNPVTTEADNACSATGQIPMFYPSKRISFDGSKLGIYPSTIHPNNLLIFNKEYMDMLHLLNANPQEKTKANVLQKFKLIERLQSPDAIHLYAVLMYQLRQMEDAEQGFKDAIHQMVLQKGCLTRQSELLHNAIEFYKHHQADEITRFLEKPSKYKEEYKIPT
jgi:GR25 family glycosyltransferase involved in LPS biosynthesis